MDGNRRRELMDKETKAFEENCPPVYWIRRVMSNGEVFYSGPIFSWENAVEYKDASVGICTIVEVMDGSRPTC